MNDMRFARRNVSRTRASTSLAHSRSSFSRAVKTLLILALTFCLQQQIEGQELLELKYRLEEEQRAGTYVGNIFDDANVGKIYDSTALQQLQFRFLRQQQYFVIDNLTGIIRTNSQIDREAICPSAVNCDIRVDVVLQPQPFFRIIRASVAVLDINDNWPQYDHDEQVVDVPESAPVGAILLVISATDLDSPEFSIQKYQLISDFDRFELSTTGRRPDGTSDSKLMLTRNLDRELADSYRLQIMAIDSGYPPNTGYMYVTIRVLDVNDNIPKFEQENYTIAVMENVRKQTTVLRLLAVDGDVGPNGQVVYGLSLPSKAAYGDMFGMDNSTGDLYVKGDLDFEKISEYFLTVVARDGGADSTPVTASVTVLVGDANDNAPKIMVSTLSLSPGNAEVFENSALGTFVAYFTVIDQDSGDNGRFECRLNDTHFRIMPMYSTEYQILTASPVDREVLAFYNLTLTCTDFGEKPQESVQTLRVLVTDVNDNTPVFSQKEYREELIENNYIGKVVTTVNATDQDSGNNGEVSYSLSGELADKFQINPDTGVITAAVSFDREDTETVLVDVIARDKGYPSRSSSSLVHVTILDVNDERPIFSHTAYSFAVMENLAPGAEVGTVAAHDRDSSIYGEVTYAVLPTDGSDLFDIDQKRGVISTAKTLDREAVSTYYLMVIASDREVPPLSSTASVTVYVSDENDNSPVFDYPAQTNNTVRISNRTPKGHVITRLRAHDLDVGENGKITFDITQETKGELFDLNMELGTVFVNGDLTDMDGRQFLFEFMARDEGSPRKMAFARLNVIVNKSVSLPRETMPPPLMASPTLTVLLIAVISGILIIILVIAIIIVCLKGQEKQSHKYNCRTETLKMFSKPEKPSLSDCSDYAGATEHGHSAEDSVRKEPDMSMEEHDYPSERSQLAIENPYTLQADPASGSLLGSNAKLCVNGVPCHVSAASKFAGNDHQGCQTVPLLQAAKESESNRLGKVLNDNNDADSLHSGEGSNADSGHGPSEEGESNANVGRPLVVPDLHNNSVQVEFSKKPIREPVVSYRLQSNDHRKAVIDPGHLVTDTNTNTYPCSHSYPSQSPLSSFGTFSPRHLHCQNSSTLGGKTIRSSDFAGSHDFGRSSPGPHCQPSSLGYAMLSPECHYCLPQSKVSSPYSVRSLGRGDGRSFVSGDSAIPTNGSHDRHQRHNREIWKRENQECTTNSSELRPTGRHRLLDNGTLDSSDSASAPYSCASESAVRCGRKRAPISDSNDLRMACQDNNETVDSRSCTIDPYDLCEQIDDIFFRDKMTTNYARP